MKRHVSDAIQESDLHDAHGDEWPEENCPDCGASYSEEHTLDCGYYGDEDDDDSDC